MLLLLQLSILKYNHLKKRISFDIYSISVQINNFLPPPMI